MHELTLIKASISTFACSKLRRTWYKIFQASIISSKKHKSQSTMEDIVSFNLYQDICKTMVLQILNMYARTPNFITASHKIKVPQKLAQIYKVNSPCRHSS